MNPLRPVTTFLTLRAPAPYVLDYRDRVEDAAGDQIEELGRNLRMVVEADPAAAGDLLGLTNAGAELGAAVVNSMVRSASGGRAMVDLLGLRNAADLIADPLVAGSPVRPGEPLQVGGPPSVAPAVGAPVSVAPTSARTVQNQIGFAVGPDAFMLDGTGPLVAHRQFACRKLVAAGSAPATVHWDDTFKRLRARANILGSGNTVAWPVPIPADFLSFDNGEVDPFLLHLRVQTDATVQVTFLDSDGTSFDGTPQSAVTWTLYSMAASLLDGAVITPNTHCYLVAAFDGSPQWVEVEAHPHVRYQPRRQF